MKEELISWKTAKLGESIGYPFKTIPNVPTQSLLQRWLREVHKIEIDIRPCFTCYDIDVWKNKGYDDEKDLDDDRDYKGTFNTYESALEQGLYEALKLVVKNERSSNKL